MSSTPRGLRVHRPAVRMTDTELLRAMRAGDPSAFAELCTRHAPALRRSARSILRMNPAVVDDVVQEGLLRVHRALLRDDRHIEVRPYLFRTVRNCCLDEIARSQTDSVAPHLVRPSDEPSSATDAVHTVLERRERLTTTFTDLAALPETQRHALLRREIDGLTHQQVAAELGISSQASRSLVLRARETLTRAAAARNADCQDIRTDLLRSHDERRRASVHALRHVASCGSCRAFRASLKSDRRALRVLAPAPLLLGGLLVGGKSLGLLAGAGKPAGLKATVAVGTALLTAGGAYELQSQVFGPGERSPIDATGVALPSGHLRAGQRVPVHTAIVTVRVELPALGPVPVTTLTCPSGTFVAGLVPEGAARRSYGFDAGTVIGKSRTPHVRFASRGPLAGATVDVAMLCRVPNAAGSVRAAPATVRNGAPVVHICRRRTALSTAPHQAARGTVTARQPLAVLASRSGWLEVRTDGGRTGWVSAGVIC